MSTTDQPVFSFSDWLATGTVAQRTVVLHNDRSIPDRLDQLEARRKVAAAVAGEVSITDTDEVAAIDEAIDALAAAWEASQETWVLRALSGDEIDEIRARHDVIPAPAKPSAAASAEQVAEHEAAMLEWATAAARVREESNVDLVVTAFVSLTTSRGVLTAITADDLRALRGLPGRQGDFVRLVNAAVEATESDVELPAPFSQRTSRTSPA